MFQLLSIYLLSRHFIVPIDEIVHSYLSAFEGATGLVPKFAVHGGTRAENLALQNVQVASRVGF